MPAAAPTTSQGENRFRPMCINQSINQLRTVPFNLKFKAWQQLWQIALHV